MDKGQDGEERQIGREGDNNERGHRLLMCFKGTSHNTAVEKELQNNSVTHTHTDSASHPHDHSRQFN